MLATPVVTLAEMKDHLSFTGDMGTLDDALLTGKVAAAQAHVERMLGYGLDMLEPVPAPLAEAVMQLAAWWYEQREAATLDGNPREVPFGVREIVAEYRGFTF